MLGGFIENFTGTIGTEVGSDIIIHHLIGVIDISCFVLDVYGLVFRIFLLRSRRIVLLFLMLMQLRTTQILAFLIS